jgi:Tfp pilus assembly protein PilV
MNNKLEKSGFSLIEVLLAVGTLAIGMIFIGGTFLAGIHFSTIATERTIAAVAADEAFAKIKLYGGIDTSWLSALSTTECKDFSQLVPVDANEFAYPSTDTDLAEKQYFWSALCRRVADNPNRLVQVTVFVSRKVGSGSARPVLVKVNVQQNISNNSELVITDGNEALINDGYTIVENTRGKIYRVIKRYAPPDDERVIQLDRNWIVFFDPTIVWVVPPPVGGGRYPCIAVYQTEIRF